MKTPPYDRELAAILASNVMPGLAWEVENLPDIQRAIKSMDTLARDDVEAEGLAIQDLVVRTDDGHEMAMHHVFDPTSSSPRPCVYFLHGGGLILGTPWGGAAEFVRWILEFGVSVVTADYRLLPGVVGPTPLEDCYAGLEYVAEHAAELGIDPAAIVVAGISAGGGLAAGVALTARDRSGPALLGQVLIAPMLDPVPGGESMNQFTGGPWSRAENLKAWGLLLDGRAPEAVGNSAPGRIADLSGLPPAFLDVGSAEIFRSEVVDYANRLWGAGGSADLHVWAGGFHGFFGHPHPAISEAAVAAQRNWFARLLGYGPLQERGMSIKSMFAKVALGEVPPLGDFEPLDYFDALDAAGLGPESYLRAATGMTATAAGAILPERGLRVRISATGVRSLLPGDFEPLPSWHILEGDDQTGGLVWLETEEAADLYRNVLGRMARGIGGLTTR